MAKPTSVVRLTAVVVGVAYAIALYLSGVHLKSDAKHVLSYLPAALALALTAWDLWLWRLPLLHRVSKRPLIAGTWVATLTPTAASHIPEGGIRGPIEAYLVITQTYWSITVRQYTAESTSDSRAAMWQQNPGNAARELTFTYSNRPLHSLEERSQPHLGTAELDVVGMEPSAMSGDYFTDRYTKGDMQLTLVDRTTRHADFAAARSHVAAHA
jgi:hypothetical protein